MSPFLKFTLSAISIFAFGFVGTVLFFILIHSTKPATIPAPKSTTAVVANAVSASTTTASGATEPTPAIQPASSALHNYIEIVDSCGVHYEGACANARSGPSTSSPAVLKLRTGIVLSVATDTVEDASGNSWYKIIFDEWIRYPERVSGDMYVAASNVRFFQEPVEASIEPGATTTTPSTKSILISRSKQMLYAYDGDTLFLETPVSTGLELTPTPRGTFTVYRKSPTRYMQGPLPGISDQYYDLPGVPWDLYFTAEGGAIHGAYWHNEFGKEWSHGCVNLPLDVAQKLYDWADVGTKVTVRD